MTETMRAVVLHAAKEIRVEDWPIPSPGPGELLLEVTAAGICGTDASFYELGPGGHDGAETSNPLVLGHEFAGIVTEVGAGVTGFDEGEVVSSGAGISCGECRPCRMGKTNLCVRYSTAGIHRDGGLAEYCAVAAATCEPVAQHGVRGDDAGLAQPMAIAHHSVHRGRLEPGERALIFGVGGIGMFATWIASQHGAEVTAVDLSADRLEIARRVGAAQTFMLDEGDLPEELANSEPFDVIYEITGAPKVLAHAMNLARRGCRVVLTGLQKTPYQLLPMALLLEELELIASAALVRAVDLPAALDLVAERAEGWADIAPDVLPLEHVVGDGIIPLVERRAPHIKTLVDPRLSAPRGYRR